MHLDVRVALLKERWQAALQRYGLAAQDLSSGPVLDQRQLHNLRVVALPIKTCCFGAVAS